MSMIFVELEKQLSEVAAIIVFKLKVDFDNPAVFKVLIDLPNMFCVFRSFQVGGVELRNAYECALNDLPCFSCKEIVLPNNLSRGPRTGSSQREPTR